MPGAALNANEKLLAFLNAKRLRLMPDKLINGLTDF